MLTAVIGAAQASVPLWTWAFFVVALIVVVGVASVGIQRARDARGGGRGRADRGLTPEQRAFQDEMRVMLEARLQERRAQGDPPAEAEPPAPC